MAGSNRINALDEGASTVKLASFSISGDGALTLERYAIQELGVPWDKSEGRLEAVALAVPGLIRAAKIVAPLNADVSIPTQAVFVRHVKLPQADLPQMHEMISLEALQNVPFPIAAAALDYAFTPPPRGGEGSEGFIVAVKRPIMEKECQVLRDVRIEPGIVTVSAVAMYNAYRYNYELGKECVLLINIGAASTVLFFIEGPAVYTRVISQAGHFITQNLVKELHESFPAAEETKRAKGQVNLGASFANPDDMKVARVSQSIRLSLIRIANEMSRAIDFYQSQRDGSPPVRILVSGGSARLPYLDSFLNKKLNLPVEYFNPFRNVAIGDGVDLRQLARDHVCLGELVGLAAHETGATPLPVALNAALLPEEREKEQRDKEKEKEKKQAAPKTAKKTPRPKRARAPEAPAPPPEEPVNPLINYAALVVWAFVCLLPAIYNWRQVQIIDKMAETEESQLSQFSTYQEKLQKQIDEMNRLQAQVTALQKLQTQRDGWLAVLQAVNQSLPKGMWITAFNPAFRPGSADADGAGINQIQLRALYFAGDKNQPQGREPIEQFVRNLAQSPWFDVDPARLGDSLVGDPGSGNGQLAMDFQLRLKLKRPLP